MKSISRCARVLVVPIAMFLAPSGRPFLQAQDSTPRAELVRTSLLALSGEVDSNSPAVWNTVGGLARLYVMTSTSGIPSIASGASLSRLGTARRVTGPEPGPGGGVWMEAVVPDVEGAWYGYYHNEIPADMCGGGPRVVPRLGAALSLDRGQTWKQLGILLEAPRSSYDCATKNRYFVGGVGDVSVQLDPTSHDLYIFFSEYLRMEQQQGVGIARLAWADRDNQAGKLMVWRTRSWVPVSRAFTTSDGETRWSHQLGLPIFPPAQPWHDEDTVVDAFWGPSVHWNTYLNQYVMLLNRAKNENFDQEGIYVSFAPRLDDPRLWSTPRQILKGGSWYPQVLGLEGTFGTDKTAGEVARYFMGGKSDYYIRFLK